MSPEAQRIVIAEACGWSELTASKVWPGRVTGYAPNGGIMADTPHYVYDLNAMHGAEKTLIKKSLGLTYYAELIAVTTVDRFFLIHATAGQRAEAFLRTIGKWDETK